MTNAHAPKARLRLLMLTALGIVFGDIGTSPLYTIKEAFGPEYGLVPSPDAVYGILSLVFWSIVLVVAIKYLLFILRADNAGEGGVLALLALVQRGRWQQRESGRRTVLVLLGVFGTALLFGDGMITPAISVLGAIEGLEVVTPSLEPYVVVITVVILCLLFLGQRFGTARVGRLFGPITLLWFVTIGVLGAAEIARGPRILAAVNPFYGVQFFLTHGATAFLALGAVFLAVTGAEALYADIGHFGTKPIRLAFFALVLPALLLNYFGQGALLLRDPEAIQNPFYLLAPRWFLYPLLLIATLAAIVASQALISGVFSLAQQAVQLGFSPRLTVVHTSEQEFGQVYVPAMNWLLALGTLLIVVTFRSSSALGAAYGIAVTGTMAITTLLFAVVAREQWRWSLAAVVPLTAFFFLFDFAFLGANIVKIAHGGWVPMVIALFFLTLMTTWKRGRGALSDVIRSRRLPLDLFLQELERHRTHRVTGTAVFLTSETDSVPDTLLHHLKHNQALHAQVVLLSIASADRPYVEDDERVQLTTLTDGFYGVVATYGFMESPDVPRVLALCEPMGLHARASQTSFFLGRERLLTSGPDPMARWRKQLFAVMARNARSASAFFNLPPNRVVELGSQIEL